MESHSSDEGSEFEPEEEETEDDLDELNITPSAPGRVSKRIVEHNPPKRGKPSNQARNGLPTKRRRGEEEKLGAEIQNLSSRLHNVSDLLLLVTQ